VNKPDPTVGSGAATSAAAAAGKSSGIEKAIHLTTCCVQDVFVFPTRTACS
jgi:hypothetical protein